MAITKQSTRVQHHRISTSGDAFTVPISDDSLVNWLITDLAVGEIGINLADDSLFFRTSSGIVEIGTLSGSSAVFYRDTNNVNSVVLSLPQTSPQMFPNIIFEGNSVDLGSPFLYFCEGMIVSGAYNTVDGSNSSIVSGAGNTLNNSASSIVSGASNYVQATGTIVSGVSNTVANYGASSSIVSGYSNTVNLASQSIVSGISNIVGTTAAADASAVFGTYSNLQRVNELCLGGGGGFQNGPIVKNQRGFTQIGNVSTSTTPVQLNKPGQSGGPSVFIVPSDVVMIVRLRVLAINSGATGGTVGAVASFSGEGVIKNIGGTLSVLSTITMTQDLADASMTSTSCTATPDASYNHLSVLVVGNSGETLHWNCEIEYVQTGY